MQHMFHCMSSFWTLLSLSEQKPVEARTLIEDNYKVLRQVVSLLSSCQIFTRTILSFFFITRSLKTLSSPPQSCLLIRHQTPNPRRPRPVVRSQSVTDFLLPWHKTTSPKSPRHQNLPLQPTSNEAGMEAQQLALSCK